MWHAGKVLEFRNCAQNNTIRTGAFGKITDISKWLASTLPNQQNTAQPYLPNVHGRLLSCGHWDYISFWRNFLNRSFKSHFPLRSQTHRFPKAFGLWFGRKPWTEWENVAICSSLASSQHCDFGKPFRPVSFSFKAVKKQIARAGSSHCSTYVKTANSF